MVQEGSYKLSQDDEKTFFLAVKKGDITTVREYIESRRASPNISDSNGNSLIYWACLCDQLEIVKFLLENGAKYDASSTEGERSFLAAQNPDIRKLLKATSPEETNNNKRHGKGKGKGKGGKKQKGPKNGMQFDNFLARLLQHRPHADVHVLTTGADGERDTQHVHAFLLYARARNTYLTEKLDTRVPGHNTLCLEEWSSLTFGYVLHFLYTGDMECSLSTAEETCMILKTLGYCGLAEDISTASATNNSQGSDVLCVKKESNRKELKNDLHQLALKTIPISIVDQFKPVPSLDKGPGTLFSDVIFQVRGVDFHIHRIFFEDRCDHFKKMIANYFKEGTPTNGNLPLITVNDVAPETFGQLVLYFYTDEIHVTRQLAVKLLEASLKYKVHLLTQRISQKLDSLLTCQNVPQFYRTAKKSNMKKVAEACVHFMCGNLDQMMNLNMDLFTNLVVEFSGEDFNVSREMADVLSDSYEKEQISERDAREKLHKLNGILTTLDLEPVRIRFDQIMDRKEGGYAGVLCLQGENEQQTKPVSKPNPESSPRKYKTTVFRVNLHQNSSRSNQYRYLTEHREHTHTEAKEYQKSVEVSRNTNCGGSRMCVVQ